MERTEQNPELLPRLTYALLAIAISMALLIPLFWQDHIQAGDLGSHVYNAWLATQIRSGAVGGLAIAYQWTNVLGDWALELLLRAFGPDWAEGILASIAALLFFWGAFRLLEVVSGRSPWIFAPNLAMLTFGLVFQFGFLNFYLSTALSLWLMALLWQPTKKRAFIAAPIALLALLAHALPLAWAAAVLVYVNFAPRLGLRRQKLLLGCSIGMILLLRIILMSAFANRWSLEQLVGLVGLSGVTGVEQVWLYGPKYLIVAAGAFIVGVVLFLARIDQGGIVDDPLAQICFLQAVAFLLLPQSLSLPQYQFPFTFIAQRMSLFSALLLSAAFAKARYGRGMVCFSVLVATVFFTFLYFDDRALSSAEKEIGALVETLPPGQRVVAAIGDSSSRLNPLGHTLDRRCVGHCFSYGNYEAPTAQFRIRVLAPNPVEAPDMNTVKEIEEGTHIVTREEAPLYSICPCEDARQRFCIRPLAAGERTCAFSVPITPEFSMRKLQDLIHNAPRPF